PVQIVRAVGARRRAITGESHQLSVRGEGAKEGVGWGGAVNIGLAAANRGGGFFQKLARNANLVRRKDSGVPEDSFHAASLLDPEGVDGQARVKQAHRALRPAPSFPTAAHSKPSERPPAADA